MEMRYTYIVAGNICSGIQQYIIVLAHLNIEKIIEYEKISRFMQNFWIHASYSFHKYYAYGFILCVCDAEPHCLHL